MGKTLDTWVRSNEKDLLILVKNPKKWEFCQKFILPKSPNQIQKTLRDVLKIQNIVNEELEAPITDMLVTLQ